MLRYARHALDRANRVSFHQRCDYLSLLFAVSLFITSPHLQSIIRSATYKVKEKKCDRLSQNYFS